MEYFRWILLIAGILLLVYMVFSGRRKRSDSNYMGRPNEEDVDPLFTDHRAERSQTNAREPVATEPDAFDRFEPSINLNNGVDDQRIDDDDMDFFTPLEDLPQGSTNTVQQLRLFASIAEKIESFSAKLTPKRKERMAASAARAGNEKTVQSSEEKIISISVMAAEGATMDGAEMYAIFSQRGYEFGEMGIFHSRYKGKKIFSIVNMIEPGSFDINDIASLETPGVTLFLQLPGPIAADVLFEVLVSEASDIARTLGASVRDSQRSTLTKQTIQHMREEIYQYMHRQKYFAAKVR